MNDSKYIVVIVNAKDNVKFWRDNRAHGDDSYLYSVPL